MSQTITYGKLESDDQEGIQNIQWQWGDGKISKITRSMGTTANEISYKYDAFGRRTLKLVKPVNNGNPSTPDQWTYTYYSYDASGNVMGVYELQRDMNNNQYEFYQKEAHIYGASRLGLHDMNKILVVYDNIQGTATEQAPAEAERVMGQKFYELSNHLGNVLAVVSDRKLTATANDYWNPDVISYSDYYPFGMVIHGRSGEEPTITGEGYRYGFNGMEKDDEVKGTRKPHDHTRL